VNIGGIRIILLLGILNFLLILFQISTGLRWIRVPFGTHRKTGVTLLISASLHSFLALLAL